MKIYQFLILSITLPWIYKYKNKNIVVHSYKHYKHYINFILFYKFPIKLDGRPKDL